MATPMMACGHAANATMTPRLGAETVPVCAICYGIDPKAQEVIEAPDLTGRQAECNYDRRKVPSSTGLAFFEHRPDRPYDAYYCGCFGWD